MPDMRTVLCRRGPRSLPGGRIVTTGDTAHDVDVDDAQIADLVAQGALEVVQSPARARKPTTKHEREVGS